MVLSYLSPSWFFGYDVFLEILFAITAIIISLFAFKIYKATNQNQIKLFGISFAFISLSYVLQSIFNYLAIEELNETYNLLSEMQTIIWFKAIGLYAHMLFMIIGLAILVYMTFKTKKIRVLWLLIVISLLGIFFSINMLYMFFLFSSIYLLILLFYFANNYFQNKQKKTLLIATAFLFMFFSSVHFLISVDHQLFYAIGHILELVAYILILINFYLVLYK